MPKFESHIGAPHSRVDGTAKVTGTAKYAGEYNLPGLAHGYVVSSAVAKGRIASIAIEDALAVPGVIKVYTHENRPRTAWFSFHYRDQIAPPGTPFRPLYDDEVVYSGQPIALVVAEDFATARHAASLVRVEYRIEDHETDLEVARAAAYVPPKERAGIAPPPKARGDARSAFAQAPIRLFEEYRIAREHHNPMELHATTVSFDGEGAITVYDKIQGVQNSQGYVAGVFGLSADKVRVLSPFVGGAFGCGLRPQYQLFLAVMAALDLERSVRVELTRAQMFSHVHRPETINSLWLGAGRDGRLKALRHEAVQGTSRFEDYQEVVVNWSGLLYHFDNAEHAYTIAKLDTYTPGDMRAPGAPLGTFAIESAMDEIAHQAGIDPLAMRLKNYAETDENDGKPFSSKELRACYQLGAERFGWARRRPEPRSMREGRELIGWGMASGAWEAQMMKTAARAVLTADGHLEVCSATADIGTGTYTILTQIAADTLGLDMDAVSVLIGDSSLPASPVQGGSWTAASAGSAVQAACIAVREQAFKHARAMENSPLANETVERVVFERGRIALEADPSRSVGIVEAMRSAGVDRLEAEAAAGPGREAQKKSSYTHSAVFAEVRVDEQLGIVRVTKIVNAVAAGRILNPKTARSQIVGGTVWGIGMALHEETLTDHRLGRFMNRNLGEYHVPVNADIDEIDVIFVDEHDDANPLGIKGLGEIGIVATPAAIANAIFHATGTRIRSLPITIDKILAGETAKAS